MVVPLSVMLIAGVIALQWYIPIVMIDLSKKNIKDQSIETLQQFKTLRGYYTQHVVKKVIQGSDIRPAVNHVDLSKKIPLPATMIHDMSALVSTGPTSINLYSAFPFPNRADRVLDDFEIQAWDKLNKDPSGTFVLEEKIGDKYFLRVAIPDKMVDQSCINCHNSHPDTPKVGWKMGDVRGVLEIKRDLSQTMFHARKTGQNLAIILGVFVFLIVALMIIRAYRISKPLKMLTNSMSELIDGNLDTVVPTVQATDELHKMSQAISLYKSTSLENKELLKNTMRHDFLVNISHEIRTPLAGLMGVLNLIKPDQSWEEIDHFIGLAKASSHNLRVIVDDLLDISAISSQDNIHLDWKFINAEKLFHNIIEMMQPIADEKKLQLVSDIPPDLPLVHTDPTRLTQIVINLINNAIKFTERGSVTLSIALKADTQGRYTLSATVSDTGIGIADDKLNLIFNRFEQIDSSLSRANSGLGLGLSIAKQLVDAMKGAISVQSIKGRGTDFTVTLPVETKTAPPAQAVEFDKKDKSSAGKNKNGHILIVEDMSLNQLIIEKMLDEIGYSYEIAGDGQQALDLLNKKQQAPSESFDAILMDIQMPVKDGMECTQDIRRKWPDDTIKIYALTAHAMADHKEKCIEMGFNGFVIKPIDLEILKETLEG